MANQTLIDELVGNAHGNLARVQEILSAHPELVNAAASWGETPVQAATQVGDIELTTYLLDLGAPLDICTAAMLGRGDLVAGMLAGDPALAHATGAHGLPALYFPAVHGELAIAQMLLASGAEINAGEGKMTPLHAAVAFDQPAMARWLLDQGADPNARNRDGKTPGQLALEKGSAELAALFG